VLATIALVGHSLIQAPSTHAGGPGSGSGFTENLPETVPNGRRLLPESRPGPQPELTGRVLVRWRPTATSAQRLSVMARTDAVVDPSAPDLATWQVLTPDGEVGQTVAALKADPAVAWAEPEYVRRPTGAPGTDPAFPLEWGLHNDGQDVGGFAGAPNVDMNLPEAWQLGLGEPGVTVAVIDTGVDFSHPDLQGTAWVNSGESGGGKETNGVDDDGNGYVDDVNGWDFCHDDNTVFEVVDGWHGTAMATIIGASANGLGMTGIAPGVRIMALKIFDVGGTCGVAAEVAAIEYAVDQGVKIANASYGGGGFSEAERLAILNASGSGMLLVASAGNEGTDIDVNPSYPASYVIDNLIAVAAIHNEGMLADCASAACSNWGLQSVHIAAPGEDVFAGVTLDDPDPYAWGLVSGTSPAAASVSGVAALIGSNRPELFSGSLLKAHLLKTGKPVPWTRGLTASGRIPDARAALTTSPDVVRLSGPNRYATAAAISAFTYFRYPPLVLVANGTGFPDALAGGAVGAQFGFPLLLVQHGSIPPETAAELTRLRPLGVAVLGGLGVVSAAVEAQLAAYVEPGGEVFRLAGPDRFATAVAISQGFDPGVSATYVATGLDFPDALGAAPLAAFLDGPLLLVLRNSIPPVVAFELDRLAPSFIYVLGGTGVVSQNVENSLWQYTNQGTVWRRAGSNRYETAVAVSQTFAGPGSAGSVFVATGVNFPDALAGGSSAGAFLGSLLLVPGTSVPSYVEDEILRLDPARVFILGGTGVVSDGVIAEIQALFP
jgi:subtilisin family serine protease